MLVLWAPGELDNNFGHFRKPWLTTDSWIFVDTCRQVVTNFHNLFSQVVARLRWDTKIDRTVVLWPGYDATITTPTYALMSVLWNVFTILFVGRQLVTVQKWDFESVLAVCKQAEWWCELAIFQAQNLLDICMDDNSSVEFFRKSWFFGVFFASGSC